MTRWIAIRVSAVLRSTMEVRKADSIAGFDFFAVLIALFL
jgi:hypothetical protein